MPGDFPRILHHGARTGVTGSCHELRLDEDSGILIDCGLFQGAEASDRGAGEDRLEIEFPVAHIRALVVTHVHIDHVGRIPYLLAAGFRGPIYCSEPSARLLPLVLEDAVKIGVTRDRKLVEAFIRKLSQQIVPLAYDRWHTVVDGGSAELAVKLQRAGHIFGSAYVCCRIRKALQGGSGQSAGGAGDYRVVFSGDLGAPHAPLIPAPRSPYRADLVVLESTYGDRLHENRRDRRSRLKEVIERALQNRGAVLVPAFSIGRTQELLYELEELIHRYRRAPAAEGVSWDDLEVIVDSPLASRFTEVFKELKPFWDAEAANKVRLGRHPLGFEQLTTVAGHRDHLQAVDYLKKSGRPCVVIAAGGMCSGGRIVNYLKALVGDPRTDVLFVGYQAQGTPGRAIQHYGPKGGYVVFDGRRYPIRAQVHTIGGYSAHADQKNLVDFIRRIRHRPQEIRLVHGDDEAKHALKAELTMTLPGVRVVIPS